MVNFSVYLNMEEKHSDSKYTNMQPVSYYQRARLEYSSTLRIFFTKLCVIL